MSKAPATIPDVLPPALAKRVSAVKEFHKGVLSAFERQIAYAFLCGLELHAIKASLPHGEFMAFREKWLPGLSHSAAQRYMDFVALLEVKLPTVGNLAEGRGRKKSLKAKEKKALLKAVYEEADGKTWTAFYRDLALIRGPKAPEHHPQKKLSAEEAEAAAIKEAEETWTRHCGNIERDRDLISLLARPFRDALCDQLTDLAKFIRGIGKRPTSD